MQHKEEVTATVTAITLTPVRQFLTSASNFRKVSWPLTRPSRAPGEC